MLAADSLLFQWNNYRLQGVTGPMMELSEQAWKDRFQFHLAGLFVQVGLEQSAAVADANAHADDQYPRRGPNTPEQEADKVHDWLQDA